MKVTALGPVGWILLVMKYAIPLAALAVTVDALRRPATDYGCNSARRWMWATPQIALIVVTLLGYLSGPVLPAAWLSILTYPTLLLLVFGVPMQVAYLLVVVFPRHREHVELPENVCGGEEELR